MKLFRKDYKTLSDEELMRLYSKGDKAAFEPIYDRYEKFMVNFFYRKLWSDRIKAEDFAHDLFTKLIDNPELFDTERNFKAWLFSVASNMCKNEYKKQEVRKGTNNSLNEETQVKDDSKNSLNETHHQLFKEKFDVEIQKLDQKHREVLELRHFDGLSMKEIAEVLLTNEGTVKSRLFYATKYLAQSLKEYQPDELKIRL
jgi:RNA polymerase sigma factor (sigma-70 family)